MPEFEFAVLLDYYPELLAGALVTLEIAVISIAIGMIVGLFLALARLSGRRWLSWPAYGYIEFFRTTPPLIQIVWAYFVIPVLIGHEITSLQAACLALGLNIAAFLAEIFRAGIQGVDATQQDATQVLGLSTVDAYRFVILPQAIRIVLPPTATTVMLLMKSTALASAIGTLELMRTGQLITTETFQPLEVLTAVAVIYFVLTYPVVLISERLERRMRVGQD